MPLTLQAVLKLSTNSKTFLLGQAYYRKNKVCEFSSKKNKNGKTTIFAEVIGTENRFVEIVLDNEGNIMEYVCSCPSFSSHPGACKHIVAVLTDYLIKNNPVIDNVDIPKEPEHEPVKIFTDPVVKHLFDQYQNIGYSYLDKYNGLLSVVPTLCFNKKSLPRLIFKLDGNSQIPIENITKFTEDVLGKNEKEYNKVFKVIHNLEYFDDSSRSLIQIILNSFNYEFEKNNPRNEICVNAVMLDNIFSIYLENNLNINRNDNLMVCKILDRNPNLTLTINKSENNMYNISCEHFHLMSGFEYLYIQKGNEVYRCNKAYKEATYDFLTTIMQQKDYTLNINQDDINDFYSVVLSQIKKYFTLNSDIFNINDFLPDLLTPKLFLDEPTTDVVTGKLEFWYNDKLMNNLSSENAVDIKRNILSENKILKLLTEYFTEYNAQEDIFYIKSKEKILTLMKYGLDRISQRAVILTSNKFNQIKFIDNPTASMNLSLDGQNIGLNLSISGARPNELFSLLQSYKDKNTYHRLENGTFIRLNVKLFSKIEQLITGLNLQSSDIKAKKIKIPKYRAFFLNQFISNNNTLDLTMNDEFCGFMEKLNRTTQDEIIIPPPLDNVLREYQVYGVRFMSTVINYGFSCILADDMGLGKTLQVIALLLLNKTNMPSLVVCPSSLVYNWEKEIKIFNTGLKSLVVSGNASKRQNLLENINDYDVVITSYDQLKRDIDLYKDINFLYHIIDEAQYIKNQSTLNSKSVSKINSLHRIALTGTPIENRLSELWSIFNFLMPGYLFSYKQFRNSFEIPITKENDTKQLELLISLISPFILRRLKKNVLKELPDKNEIIVLTPLEEEQEKIYNNSVLMTKQYIKEQIENNTFEKNQINILSQLTVLRQICCEPSLCSPSYTNTSAKLTACLDLIESAVMNGHKILVFSQFTSMLSIIQQYLNKNNVSHYLLKGSTPQKHRLEMVDKFNSDNTKVFLISLKAGGTGLNLTGADIVIHYDPWWNLAAQNQATDRAYRIGQKNSVTVYKIIAKDTIEEQILSLQNSKNNLAESIIQNAEGSILNMSSDDLLSFFDINK